MAGGIRLIGTEERLTLQVDGSVFHYRRIPADVRARIVRTNTVRGKENWEEITRQLLQYAVRGWENVNDAAGEPVQFSSDLVEHLPESVRGAIVEVAFNETASREGGPTKPSA